APGPMVAWMAASQLLVAFKASGPWAVTVWARIMCMARSIVFFIIYRAAAEESRPSVQKSRSTKSPGRVDPRKMPAPWKYGSRIGSRMRSCIPMEHNTQDRIKLALVDDQAMFRRGLAMLLRDMPDVQVVFECPNGEELMTGLDGNAIDIVLLDLEMPVMDGMEAMRRARAEHPEVKVIVLSMHSDEKFIIHLMELGAN